MHQYTSYTLLCPALSTRNGKWNQKGKAKSKTGGNISPLDARPRVVPIHTKAENQLLVRKVEKWKGGDNSIMKKKKKKKLNW